MSFCSPARINNRFTGEIRATGEALVDMVSLMQRSGFNAVSLRADQSLEAAERALRFFPGYYQHVTTVTLTPAQFQDKTLRKGQLPAGMHYVAATGGSYSPPTNCHRMDFSGEKTRFNKGAKAWGVLTK
mgnify:CR=1 FL=1